MNPSADRDAAGQPDSRSHKQSPLRHIANVLPTLSPTRSRVASAILDDPSGSGMESITALSKRAGTSPTTITRFAAQMGYTGFPELRGSIALDNGRSVQSGWEHDIGTVLRPDHPPREVLEILAGTQARTLRDSVNLIDMEEVDRAAACIASAGRVHLFAEWGDVPAMRELHMRLLRIGVSAWLHESPQEAGLAVSTLIRDGDVLLMGNRSGQSDAAVALTHTLKGVAGTAIAIHGEPDSRLAHAVDISLYTGIRNGSVWTQYFAGRASDTLVASLLWVLVAQKRTRDESISFLDTSILFENERFEQ